MSRPGTTTGHGPTPDGGPDTVARPAQHAGARGPHLHAGALDPSLHAGALDPSLHAGALDPSQHASALADRPPPAAAEGPGLRAEALRIDLGGRPVLHALSVRLATGWTAIVGPNGAGKSTLLRALAGLLPPQAGGVWLGSRPLASVAPAERARQIAWLAQQGETSGDLTVHETVALGRIAHLGLLAAPGPADHAAVDRAMALTECGAWATRRLQALSGGERQRVLLARALATEAPVLLLDEPTTHLDAPHQVALARLFRRLAASHTVVTVLHDLPIAVHADRLLLLRDGALVADGPATQPALQQALSAVFGGAVRLHASGGVPRVDLVLD